MEGLYERGVEQFNSKFFFEAHDTWEELWAATTGSHRLFYQGLIQTSVGFYHLLNGNYKGACSQFGKAIAKLEQYQPTYYGIETQQLVEHVRECLTDTEHLRDGVGGQFNQEKIPQIQWCGHE